MAMTDDAKTAKAEAEAAKIAKAAEQKKYLDCMDACVAGMTGSSLQEIVDALIDTGCDREDSRDRLMTTQDRQIKGLVKRFCSCRCSNSFPFFNSSKDGKDGDGSEQQDLVLQPKTSGG